MTPYKYDRIVEHGTHTHKKKTAVRMGLELSVVNCLVDCSVLVLSTVHSLGTLHVPQSKTFQIAGASD